MLLLLLLKLMFNKENIIQMFQVLTNVSTTFNVPIKRRFLIIGMTIIVITLIFAFDSLIEYWFGVSKEKITDHNSVFNRNYKYDLYQRTCSMHHIKAIGSR